MAYTRHTSFKHFVSSLPLIAILSAITLTAGMAAGMSLGGKTAIAAAYSIAGAAAYSLAWYATATRGAEYLVRFHLTASALRVLAALTVLAAYCLVVRDRTDIIRFAIVFLAFYAAMLVFDTVYLTRKKTANK